MYGLSVVGRHEATHHDAVERPRRVRAGHAQDDRGLAAVAQVPQARLLIVAVLAMKRRRRSGLPVTEAVDAEVARRAARPLGA